MKSVLFHSKSDNVEIDETNEVIEELLESLFFRYQIWLEALMSFSDFIFDSVNLIYNKCHKINVKLGCLCINSLDWIKKATISLKTDDHKCLQYAATNMLNQGKIKKSHKW